MTKMGIKEKYAEIQNLIDKNVYTEGSKAYIVSSKWFYMLKRAIRQNDETFSRKVNNDRIYLNGRIDLSLIPDLDFVVVPQNAWDLINSEFGSTKEIEVPVLENRITHEWKPCIRPKEVTVYFHGKPYKTSEPEDVTIEEMLQKSAEHFNVAKENAKLVDYWMQIPGSELEPNIELRQLTTKLTIDMMLVDSSEADSRTEKAPINGLCGLKNLGNTCFINSVLQCLTHCDLIKELAITGKMEKEISNNPKYEMDANVVQKFVSLVVSMWNGKKPVIAPSELIDSVAKIAKQFANFHQHDASEYLTTLLTCLNNGLMRPTMKTANHANEGMIDHALRSKVDNSLIGDICYGLIKDTTVCPICNKKNEIISSFNALTLRIPTTTTSIKVTYISMDLLTVKNFFIIKNEGDTEEILKERIVKECGTENLVFGTNDGFCKLSTDLTNVYAFEATDYEDDLYIIVKTDFIYPFIIVVDSFDIDEEIIKIFINDKLSQFWEDFDSEKMPQITTPESFTCCNFSDHFAEQTVFVKFNIQSLQTKSGIIWDSFRKLICKDTEKITIYDCLSYLSTERVLNDENMWLCPTCSKLVNAIKKNQLIYAPNVLIINLSRFKYQNGQYIKDSRPVSFSKYLDISPYVNDSTDCKYELFGVINHHGDMMGGHYTALLKIDQEWFKFSDEAITKTKFNSESTANAYILFYQKE